MYTVFRAMGPLINVVAPKAARDMNIMLHTDYAVKKGYTAKVSCTARAEHSKCTARQVHSTDQQGHSTGRHTVESKHGIRGLAVLDEI